MLYKDPCEIIKYRKKIKRKLLIKPFIWITPWTNDFGGKYSLVYFQWVINDKNKSLLFLKIINIK